MAMTRQKHQFKDCATATATSRGTHLSRLPEHAYQGAQKPSQHQDVYVGMGLRGACPPTSDIAQMTALAICSTGKSPQRILRQFRKRRGDDTGDGGSAVGDHAPEV